MTAPHLPAPAVQARPASTATFFCGEGLHKRFGGVQAVRDISLNVPRGSVFAIIGLERRASMRAASLAYGEQRMLELARALATSPRLLMLDEPAAGLNAAEVELLLERIRLLREGGMTIIVVEHNMDLVMKISDRVLVMDYGQHLFAGTPAEVQANPSVIAAYLGAMT